MRQEFSVVEEDDRRATNYYIKNCLAGGSSPPAMQKYPYCVTENFIVYLKSDPEENFVQCLIIL